MNDDDSIQLSDQNESICISENIELNPSEILKSIRSKNTNRLILAQININSIRNKFESFVDMFNDNIDILLISETKIDSSFPNAQFSIKGYSLYRRDRNAYGGGIILYVKDDIPSKILSISPHSENFYIEINMRKKKWLIGCIYNPNLSLISSQLEEIGNNLDNYMSAYDNFILLGDFNAEPSNQFLKDFCQVYSCTNIVHEKTCFKNPLNPTCIDLIITNRPKSFQSSMAIETGLSDFHKMTLTVMKVFYKKQSPNLVSYRNYKNFDNVTFMNNVKNSISCIDAETLNGNFHLFKKVVHDTFEEHAPLKKRYVRANQAPFMNKRLSREIMKRSRLRNTFLKSKKEADRIIYNKQRNFCVSLLRKEKKNFFCNIHVTDITDNKRFWKTVKPFFTDKIQVKSKITLIEKHVNIDSEIEEDIVQKIISKDDEVAQVFNDFFIDIVPNLNIPTNTHFSEDFIKSLDPVENALEKFKNHPSISMIKSKNIVSETFSFNNITYENILNKLNSLNIAKSSQLTDIPTKVLKNNPQFFANYLSKNINHCIDHSEFPSDLKQAEVVPVYKKKSKNSKDNYRPVSILSNISKIYERCMYEQIEDYFKDILSKYQCGFRKGFNAQHCLMVLIEKWKKSVDKGGEFGAVLTDLSKAFDCLSHELLIAKLEAYGFDLKSLKLVYAYLAKRNQRVKINDSFSSWKEILYGVPQGSILGPLFFNIFICDMFYLLEDFGVANYADDSTPYCSGVDYEGVSENLEKSSAILFKWLKDNYMKINTDKSHLIMSGNAKVTANIDGNFIESENQQELLGILIDSNLTFDDHITNICKKVSQKLNALTRVSTYMDIPKRRLLMKSFISSQFGYCPLIWMFHSRGLNNKINLLHKRALKITYGDKDLTYQELLEMDNSVSVHHRNLQILATEMFKVYKEISPEILNEVFERNSSACNLRNKSFFRSRSVNSVYHGTESLSFLGPKIWDLVPFDIKKSENVDIFKDRIKKWICDECPCRLCKTFVKDLGFI